MQTSEKENSVIADLSVLSAEVKPLLELMHVFNRWSAGMTNLKSQSEALYDNSAMIFNCIEDMFSETGRLCDVTTAARDVEVEARIQALYQQAKRINADSKEGVLKSEWVTTATFQDIQATCQMILTGVHNLVDVLEQVNDKTNNL